MKGETQTPKAQVRPGLRRMAWAVVVNGKLAALLLGGASGWAGYQALTSPRFDVRSVRAKGIVALTNDEIARFADVKGERIWFVQTAAIAERVRESPYVEAVTVRLELPDGVVVTVRERRPDVRWEHNGAVFAVTSDGMIIDEIVDATLPLSDTRPLSGTGTVSATLPAVPVRAFASAITVVDTTPNRPLKIRDRVDPDALELARRVSLRASKGELGQTLTRIEWDAGLGVSIMLGERQVVLGRSDDLDRKWATLQFMLRDGTQFRFLDLRSNEPYYR